MSKLYAGDGTNWNEITLDDVWLKWVGWSTNPGALYVASGGSWVLAIDKPASTPTETPGTPTLSYNSLTGDLEVSWSNTNTTDGIYLVIQCTTNLMYSTSAYIPAGSTSYTYTPGNSSTETFRVHLAYYNDAGNGPWSNWSNEVSEP